MPIGDSVAVRRDDLRPSRRLATPSCARRDPCRAGCRRAPRLRCRRRAPRTVAGLHRPAQIGDAAFEIRIDAGQVDEVLRPRRRDQRLAENRRRGADDMRNLPQLRGLGVVVPDAAGVPRRRCADSRRRCGRAVSSWSPVINASAMTSAMTPTVTPSVEMNEMTEMNACFRLASRYRNAMWSSNGSSIVTRHFLVLSASAETESHPGSTGCW